MLISQALVSHLEREKVPFALIGGVALAVWGVARFTADVDLLVLDARVLTSGFWAQSQLPPPVLRIGAGDDPLGGVARFNTDPPHDLILGKGAAAQIALDHRVSKPELPCQVADPVGLLLLKLEAGAPQDAYDVLGLLQAAEALGFPHLAQEVESFLPRLSREAQAFWGKIQSL